jgi:UDP-N-acetyl-D-mannosaminuronate dehydrogenase
MVESLLRESMDEAQIPRGRELTPPGRSPEERVPRIVVVDSRFDLSAEEAGLSEADAIVVDLAEMSETRRACAAVCRSARRGQTIVLASPGYLGATHDLLIRPLTEAGFEVGNDICVACSPPPAAAQTGGQAPRRVLGATGPACAGRARAAIEAVAPAVQTVSTPEAAELTVVLAEALRALGVEPD